MAFILYQLICDILKLSLTRAVVVIDVALNRLKQQQLCGVAGCTNTSKYSCSRSGVRLCSL